MLVYIAASKIPGLSANSVQVMKMAEALSGVDHCTLIANRGDDAGADVEILRRRYGVRRLPAMDLLPVNGRLGVHVFNLRAALKARMLGARVVLSRSIGAAAIAAWLGIPTIWECHAPPQGIEKLYWWILCRTPSFKRLVVISNALRRLMIERHPAMAAFDIAVEHDGVDLERFAHVPDVACAKKEAGLDGRRPVAGYVGHLYAGRGIDLILQCAKALPNWTFLIAGGNPQDVENLSRECIRKGLSNVKLLGHIDNAAIPSTMAVADVLLMPYQRRVMVSGGRMETGQWMSPLKMFEYLAMGRVIVASDLPVLREVIDEGCAILAPPDDVPSWVAALSRIERGGDASAALARAARETATKYAWPSRVRSILEGIG